MAPKRKAPDSEEEEDVEEEVLLSAEDEEMEGSGDEDEDESEEEVLEPKVLTRANRGGRLGQVIEEQAEHESGDEEFWNQEFWAEEEEAQDGEFDTDETESEKSEGDSDFSESYPLKGPENSSAQNCSEACREDDDDEDDDAVEARTRREERAKKKTLKPPGAAGAARKPPPVQTGTPSAGKPTAKPPLSPSAKAALKAAKLAAAAEMQAPSLRRSTKQKTEQAEQERVFAEEIRPKKRRRTGQQQRLPSQDELLAEAAQTEIENLRSLELLQAAEEEVRQRAAVKRGGYTGPCIRYKTKQINGEGLLTCEVANMLLPPNMRRQTAPAPKPKPVCVVTGRPAKYRHPVTKQPYYDVAAFHVLEQQRQQREQQRLQGSMYNSHPQIVNPVESRANRGGKVAGQELLAQQSFRVVDYRSKFK